MKKKKILAAALAMGLALCPPVQILAKEMPVLEVQEAVEEAGVRETVEDTEIQDVKNDTVSDAQPEEEIAEQNSNAGNSVFVVTSDEDFLDNTAKDMKAMESSQPEEEPEKEAEKESERKESILAEGKSGDLNWSIDSEGCFTLEGTGDYELIGEYGDGTYTAVPPWYKHRNNIKKANIKVDKITNLCKLFYDCYNLISINWNNLDTSNVISMEEMFDGCSSLKELDLCNLNTSNVTSMEGMFSRCYNLEVLDISNFNTSSVRWMRNMFQFCSNLKALDVSNFNTSNVVYMQEMFDGCSNLKELDVSNFNTSSVLDMSVMFGWCRSLEKLNLSNFNTSNVVYMRGMFDECSSLTELDVRSFNTSNVLDMSAMFCLCRNLKKLNLSNFNTSNVTNMSQMFYCCENLSELDVSHFDTSNVVEMNYMFSICGKLEELDLSSFNMEKIEHLYDIYDMYDRTALRIIKTPCNVKVEILLQGIDRRICGMEYWQDKIGNIYTTWPKNRKDSVTLIKTVDTHNYKSEITPATMSSVGYIMERCTICGDISENVTSIYFPKKITLSSTSYIYNEKIRKPTVKVANSKGKVLASTNYTVSYASGRKNVGRYKVKITFKGNYKGSVTKTFDIVPKGTSISRVTAVKKGFTVKWKKQKMQTTGYQIQCSTSRNFKKGTKTATINKNSVTSRNIKGLKAKKKYYVRVRTYKTVKINGKSTKLYSGWSKAKTIKTKK